MKESGLFYPDGTYQSEKSIRRRLLMDGNDLPHFDTPLIDEKDFNYWSKRFTDRQKEFEELAEGFNNVVEITLPGQSVINFIGDLHVGAIATDYSRIEREIEAVITTPRSYVILMGDIVDGFFFNPAQMNQIEQPPEQFHYTHADQIPSRAQQTAGWVWGRS